MIEAMGGIGSILMLSSASAPSRVPQVVCKIKVSRWTGETRSHMGQQGKSYGPLSR